jgi:hypothetical protein
MSGEVKEVQFFDGEGLDFTDLNNMQRYLRAQVWDEAFALAQIRTSGSGGSIKENQGILPQADHCYSPAGGYLKAGGSTRQLLSAAGLICQCTSASAPDGNDAKFLSYYIGDSEINVTTAIGDATNPRIDIVCVKLELEAADAADNVTRDFKDAVTGVLTSNTFAKKRKVKMTSQLVAGTPAASPVEPATPGGFVKLGAVTVPATHNTTHDWQTNGRDYRMPTRSVVQMVYPFGNGPGVNVESGWATAIASGGLQSSAGGQVVRIFPPSMGYANARLLAVKIYGDLAITTPATVELIRRFHATTAGGDTDTQLQTAAGFGPTFGQTGAVGGSATEGWWMHGRRAGAQLENFNGTEKQETLGIKITSGAANQIIRFVRWEIAY